MPEFPPAPEFPIGQRVLVDAPGRPADGSVGVVERYAEEQLSGMLVTRYLVRLGDGRRREFAALELVAR